RATPMSSSGARSAPQRSNAADARKFNDTMASARAIAPAASAPRHRPTPIAATGATSSARRAMSAATDSSGASRATAPSRAFISCAPPRPRLVGLLETHARHVAVVGGRERGSGREHHEDEQEDRTGAEQRVEPGAE